MALHTDVAASRVNAIMNSRIAFSLGVRKTVSSLLSPSTISKTSSQTTTIKTSSPTTRATSSQTSTSILNVSNTKTRWIVIGVVAGCIIVIICIILLYCRRNIPQKRKMVVTERGLDQANAEPQVLGRATMLSNIRPQNTRSAREIEAPSNQLGEQQRNGAVELNQMSDEENHSAYWKAYKKRELERRGSPEMERIRKSIESARSQDHTKWGAYRKSLLESNKSTPVDRLVKPEGSNAPTTVRSSTHLSDSQANSAGRLLEPAVAAGTSNSTINVNTGVGGKEVLDAEPLDAPPAYTRMI